MSSNYHTPVMLQECIEALNIRPDGTYVDVTFGGGGHSREIMKHLGKGGRLLAFDQDADAQQNIIADDRFEFTCEYLDGRLLVGHKNKIVCAQPF